MATPVSFSNWFGSFSLDYLALTEAGEERSDVVVAFRGQLLAGAMNFRNDRIFPHDAMLP
jgi:hypothetical protein